MLICADASRYLAQSQSRFSNFIAPAGEGPPRNPNDRLRRANQPLRPQSRGYTQRSSNPYQSASNSNHNFASRYQPTGEAPLFHSALNEFREEDDEEERERETADFFALQKSRRVFAPARLEESSETDHEGSNASLEYSKDGEERVVEDRGRGRGIRSSWNGGGRAIRGRAQGPDPVGEQAEPSNHDIHTRTISDASSKGKERMVDIGLESHMEDDDPPEEFAVEMPEDSPPAFQRFQSVKTAPIRQPDLKGKMRERDLEAALANSARFPPPPSSVETVPVTIAAAIGEAPMHDVFWGSLFLICLGGLVATFFLIFLHTSTPEGNLGDTIYTTLKASFHLFAVDTVVSVIVSLIWLALLRSYVKPLVFLILLAVPVILFSFSLYPMISSYKGSSNGNSLQDKAMRWLSFIPGIFALVWLYTIYKGRQSLSKAIQILEFASRILAANPALLGLGFATLGMIVVWTWMWLGMFTRVFLGGHLAKSVTRFIIDTTSWWLAVYFVLMYIWTLSVISGIQRSTTAATVSQWYFHRNAIPAPTSREVVTAALVHATTTLFGTICFSTFLALIIRLPLLVLPRRLVGVIAIFAYSVIPAPIAALTNPLTLTYAAIHSQSLHPSARGLSNMTFLSPSAPTTTLTPRSFSSRTAANNTPLLPYRLAKLLLHATRFIMAMALGFGGWVATARQLNIAMPEGAGIRGSAYAYVVGLVASFIGWGVLGAMEGVLSGIVDAGVVCWGSERQTAGGGRYCLEAGYLFGEGREGT